MPWPTQLDNENNNNTFKDIASRLFTKLDTYARECLFAVVSSLEAKQRSNTPANEASDSSTSVNNNNNNSSSSSKSAKSDSKKKGKDKEKDKVESTESKPTSATVAFDNILKRLDPTGISELSDNEYISSSTLLLAHYYNNPDSNNNNDNNNNNNSDTKWSCPTHSDSGFLTIALAGEPGLQVFDESEQ